MATARAIRGIRAVESELGRESDAVTIEDGLNYDRIIAQLVKYHYGNWQECADADLLDAVTFLLVTVTKSANEKIEDFLGE